MGSSKTGLDVTWGVVKRATRGLVFGTQGVFDFSWTPLRRRRKLNGKVDLPWGEIFNRKLIESWLKRPGRPQPGALHPQFPHFGTPNFRAPGSPLEASISSLFDNLCAPPLVGAFST